MTCFLRSDSKHTISDSIRFRQCRFTTQMAVGLSWQRSAYLGLLIQLALCLFTLLVLGASIACAQEADDSDSGSESSSGQAEVAVQEKPFSSPVEDSKSEDSAKSSSTTSDSNEESEEESDDDAEEEVEEDVEEEVEEEEIKKHRVKSEEFKISFELEAVVDSPSYQVVNLRTKTFHSLKLQEVAEHGQRVGRGQVILQLDVGEWEREKLTTEQAVAAARLDLEEAKKHAETMEEAIRLELEESELAERVSVLELDYFLRQGKQQQTEMWNEMLKSSEQYVEYAREEYEQLKKMYEADEITEETEEIVLRRAKNELEQAEFYLKNTRQRVERLLGFELGRQEAEMKNSVAIAKLELERKRQGKQLRLETSRLQVARAETALVEADRKLKHLQEDKKVLSQMANFSGILFWGLAARGQWKGSGDVEDILVPGVDLPPGRPLMTVIGTDKLFVRAKVSERLLNSISTGSRAFLVLTASGGKRIEVECDSLSAVPSEPDQYRADFRFVRPLDAKDYLPLMTGKIHGMTYEKENALTVPVAAVQYDHATATVKVVDSETGEQHRQVVTVGQQDEKRVEIVQGLREGEYVVVP